MELVNLHKMCIRDSGNILSLQCYGQTSASVYALIILTGNLLNHVDDTATTSAYNNGFEFKDGVKPVSYTHLDVYKRQMLL